MSIGILGAGSVGGTLGTRWAQAGHQVVFGVRDPAAEKVRDLLQRAGPNATAASPREAAAQGEVLLLAVPWGAVEDALERAGEVSGKVLLDATNPLDEELGLTHGHSTSGGERVARLAKGARVVKIFNSTGFNNMADPDYGGQAATMFYCGDDADAKAVARRLADELGFEAVDAGGLAMARTLEPLALLWIRLAYAQGMGREIAFKMLRR